MAANSASRTISKQLQRRDPVASSATAAAASAPDGDELVELPAALEMLKTTRTTFYRWMKSGVIKGMKIGRQWRFYRSELQRFLDGAAPRIELPVTIEPFLDLLKTKLQALWNIDCGVSRAFLDQALDKPLPSDDPERVQLAINRIILLAIVMRAGDIHLGPRYNPEVERSAASLRFGIDGKLQEVAEVDLRLLPNLIQWLKSHAGCDTQVHQKPQDGRIVCKVEDRSVDLRICFVPALQGEMATLRVLIPQTISFSLDKLGLGPKVRSRLEQALDSRWGVVVLTGPTSSGKTTTLYSCISRVAGPHSKVMSVEDPVEYLLPWVDQMQLDLRAGVTFPVAVRAILRSAPQALLIGEICDRDTALLSCQAALTGHLVLTSLHAPDAPSALVRMVEIGIDPFVVGDALRMVMSQRLLRVVCPDCAEPHQPDRKQVELAERWAEAGGLVGDSQAPVWMRPVGCSKCLFTGFRQRVAVSEAMPLTPELGAALRRGAGVPELRRVAIDQGMVTMLADAVRRARAGETTLSEVVQLSGSLV